MKIRVYIGVIGSGKNYLASKECDTVIHFSDALRSDMWEMLGWKPKNSDEYEIFKNTTFIGNSPNLNGNNITFTGRDLLQRYGTNIRRSESPDYWANRLIDRLKLYKKYVLINDFTIGIADCRFKNEALALKLFSNTYNVPITFVHANYKSNKYFPYSKHESEKFAQQFLDFKGTPEEFDRTVKDLLNFK